MILALRALGIGDLATAVPALRALRTAYPDEEFAVAAPRWLTPLIDLIGGVDRVVDADATDDPEALARLRLPVGRVRLAVNLHGAGPQSHRALLAAGPAEMMAYACPAAGHTEGPTWREDEHEVIRWCRLLTWYGIPADPSNLLLQRPADGHLVQPGSTIIHPGAKSPQRRWPTDRYAAVARALADAGHQVAVTGSPAEKPLADTVADLAGLPPSAVLAGRTDIADLAGLVCQARLVISGDTGIAHLATAYATPSVTLFGPLPPSRWGPPPWRPQHRALWHPSTESFDGPVHPALAAIDVSQVLAAVDEFDGLELPTAQSHGPSLRRHPDEPACPPQLQ